MIYAVSDIHGCLEKYRNLLERLNPGEDDRLLVLGDTVDRGEDGIEILLDIMKRGNVTLYLGNHEQMMRNVLNSLYRDLTPEQEEQLDENLFLWTEINGGSVTLDRFMNLPAEEKTKLLLFLNHLPAYEQLTVNGRAFILAHAGVGEWEPEKPLSKCTLHDFIWEQTDYGKVYYEKKYLVTGHVPTALIHPAEQGRIVRKNNHIAIDCGAVFGQPLGCICLDTMEEIYIE